MSLWLCTNCGIVVRPRTSNICPKCGKNSCERVVRVQKSKIIDVSKVVKDSKCISYEQSELVANAILDKQMLGFGWTPVLDFFEIDAVSGSFMGRLFGILREACPRQVLESIRIVNAVDLTESIFNSSKDFALKLYDEEVEKALEVTVQKMIKSSEEE